MKKVKQQLLAAKRISKYSSSVQNSFDDCRKIGLIPKNEVCWRRYFHDQKIEKSISSSTTESDHCSKIDEYSLFGRRIFILQEIIRDEEFARYVSGNKWRKLYFLIKSENYTSKQIKEVHSYGSLQSNAMLSMAYLCLLNGWKFKYHVDRNLEYIENQVGMRKVGNLFEVVKLRERGLDLEFIDSSTSYQQVKDDFNVKCLSERGEALQDEVLYLREGIAQKEAQLGYALLAREIFEKMSTENDQHVNVFLPSGTGTAALYLSKHLRKLSRDKFTVYTTNCVGNEEYLKRQFLELEIDEKEHPKIINTQKNYRYGQLYHDVYQIIQEVKRQTGVQFDYLYDGKGFLTLQENLSALANSPLLYIHSGGFIGNESMFERYQAFLLNKTK